MDLVGYKKELTLEVLNEKGQVALRYFLHGAWVSEFTAVPGTRVVGTLPKEIEYVNGYAGAVARDAAADPARAFLSFLTSPTSKACFKSFGLE